jgi:hypothetical protein
MEAGARRRCGRRVTCQFVFSLVLVRVTCCASLCGTPLLHHCGPQAQYGASDGDIEALRLGSPMPGTSTCSRLLVLLDGAEAVVGDACALHRQGLAAVLGGGMDWLPGVLKVVVAARWGCCAPEAPEWTQPQFGLGVHRVLLPFSKDQVGGSRRRGGRPWAE